MPTESPSTPVRSGGASAPLMGGGALPPPAALKCSVCGAASLGPTDGVVVLGETIERICAVCVRDNANDDGATLSVLRERLSSDVVDRIRGTRQNSAPASPVDPVVLDLARLRDATAPGSRPPRRGTSSPAHSASSSVSSSLFPAPSSPSSTAPSIDAASGSATTPAVEIPAAAGASGSHDLGQPRPAPPALELQSKSLPSAKASPWATVPRVIPSGLGACPTPTPDEPKEEECASNPLLDVTSKRVPSIARGCLYPGSVFTGSQRSGRNAYDVTITIVDVNLEDSTLCGYLTIKDLTETHPELTTFFDGEIIGPKYGFITGQRYGATEYDDMRHWERFEQFRRSSTRTDTIRGQMLLRDPLPEPGCRPRERDHLFLRIKEKFLVPDHSVRDINGASFAGFYYAMIDFAPTLEIEDPVPTSPVTPRSPLISTRRLSNATTTRPDTVRRQSSSGPRPDVPRRSSTTSTTRPDTPRRQSTSRAPPAPKVATLRGYYFHSLNQEPFQELSLVHQPTTDGSTFELR